MASRARSYLALGDSYTVGEGVPAVASWPVQLAARLEAAGVAVAAPTIVARTGWTTDELDAAIDTAALQPTWDLVSLLIGVNDQYRGRPPEAYGDGFAGLLRRAIGFAGGNAHRVVVVSIPDWGVTRFARDNDRDATAVAAAIDAFNAIAWSIAGAAGAAFVDVTTISRRVDALADDGLHPSADQYRLWSERIEPFARVALTTA